MELSIQDKVKYIKRLTEARIRILCKQGFYGSLLMHIDFDIDDSIKKVSSNRKKIVFNNCFLDSISNKELDFVLIHEIVHISLKHITRSKRFDNKQIFDIAADIVVNSNILKSFDMDEETIKLEGEISKHKTPEDVEGYNYSVEELYQILIEESVRNGGIMIEFDASGKAKASNFYDKYKDGFDDHSQWAKELDNDELDRQWELYNLDACEAIYIKDPSNNRGLIPRYAARAFQKLKDKKANWRYLLNNYIQEETNDYSFSPPDKRYEDGDFYLPDFNDFDVSTKDVLFMIDTSGSMSDEQITDCYSEIKCAIDQSGGKLHGWLGFFDAAIVEPKPFNSVSDLLKIKPFGGGGTDFGIIFSYIRDKMSDKNISSLVILTDGYCDYPPEEVAKEIPTIWLINNDDANPPWGKVVRINKETSKKS